MTAVDDLIVEIQSGTVSLNPQPIGARTATFISALLYLVSGGGGGVSSVGLACPAQFTVSGSPVTGIGTLAFAWVSQAANLVLAGPTSGGSATPGFRALAPPDFAQSVASVASGATITPTAVSLYEVTALAVPATIAIPSGSPVDGQKLILRIKDNGSAQALTWTTSAGGYRAITGITLPTATNGSAIPRYVGCIYNGQDSFWDVVAAQ